MIVRVIDADALIKRIDTLKHRIAGPAAGFVSEDSYECGALDGLTDAQNYAKEAQTVEAIPVMWLEELLTEPDYRDTAANILALWKGTR